MRRTDFLADERFPSASWWPERLAAVAAFTGLLLAAMPGYDVAGYHGAGSDFKTVYASGSSFLSGVRAYNFGNLERVFRANHVVLPPSWYGHAPTYPPFTFAVLSPILHLPMVPAVYVWLLLTAAAMVAAVWSLSDMAENTFGLSRAWRLLLLIVIAASPIVSFGLQIGNVSVAASALCIVAVMSPDKGHAWWRAAALTVSLLLKPHIALWILVAMLLSRRPQDRALVLKTFGLFAISLVCFGTYFWLRLPYGLQLRDYAGMVTSEIATGCLNPRNHELLIPVAEITSLESLCGFFLDSPWMQIVSGTVLALMAGALVYFSRAARPDDEGARLELLGTWSTFGLLVTYHRTHDAIILFLLLPWVFMRLRNKPSDGIAWGTLMLGLSMSLGSTTIPPSFSWLSDAGMKWLSQLLIYRQSAIATLLLMCLLLADLAKTRLAESRRSYVQVADLAVRRSI